MLLLLSACLPPFEPANVADNPNGDFDGDKWTENEGDCDDLDPRSNPGYAEEICDDGSDNDCDGSPGDCAPDGEYGVSEAGTVILGDGEADGLGAALVTLTGFQSDGHGDLIIGAPGGNGLYSFVTPLDTGTVSVADHGGSAGDELVGFASSLAAGDVDGNGYVDLAVGAPGAYDGGYLFVQFNPVHDAVKPRWGYQTREEGAGLGTSVACVGDSNGDGFDDLAVGLPFHDGINRDNAGGVHVVFGSANGEPGAPQDEIEGEGADHQAGNAVLGPGDLDGDGLGDLVVGAYVWGADEQSDAGAAYVLLAPYDSAGKLADADARIAGTQGGSYLGAALAAGDLDGDGLPDLVLGARNETVDAALSVGRAWIVRGPATGVDDLLDGAAAVLEGSEDEGWLGASLATGDLDNDGQLDVIAGAPGVQSGRGAAYLFTGPHAGTVAVGDAAAVWAGDARDATAGVAVTVGDMNEDGIDDAILSAPALGGVGAVAIFYGGGF